MVIVDSRPLLSAHLERQGVDVAGLVLNDAVTPLAVHWRSACLLIEAGRRFDGDRTGSAAPLRDLQGLR